MSDAILATFSDFRLVKGRKIAQLVFEVPIEQANEALSALGGVPQPAAERWVGIAPVDPKAIQRPPQAQLEAPQAQAPAKEPRPFHSLPLAQQAALCCRTADFLRFLKVDDGEAAAARVRQECGVASRGDIESDPAAAAHWRKIVRDFDAYKLGFR